MEIIGITGARGFVGKNLIKAFEENNIKFVCFENNILNKNSLENFFIKNKPSIIIHLAGAFDPPFENQINGNLITTGNILEIGSKYGLKKIIYASSYAVYGDVKKKPFVETDKLNPITSYGLSKVFAEKCIDFYSKQMKISSIILRFSNIYGNNNSKGVIYNFIEGIKNNKKIIINGDGNQSRNFLHIDDACLAIIKAINYKKSDIFNVGPSKGITLNQLAKELAKKYTFEVEYIKFENKQESLLIDSKRAYKHLKFVPKFEQIQIY